MAKPTTTTITAGSRPAPVLPPAPKPKTLVPTGKSAAVPASSETKSNREHRATRDACAVVRKEMLITDLITPAKPNNARQGSLRYNIIEAVQKSKTVGEAVTKQVNGTGKYANDPYTIKKVDVGFCLGNGFITTKPAK